MDEYLRPLKDNVITLKRTIKISFKICHIYNIRCKLKKVYVLNR